MTTSQIIACAIAWTAAITAVAGAALSFRAQQQARAILLAVRAERRTFPVDGGVVTFPHRMSDAEVAEFRARWQATYGSSGTACSAYQAPAADGPKCAICLTPVSEHEGRICQRPPLSDEEASAVAS